MSIICFKEPAYVPSDTPELYKEAYCLKKKVEYMARMENPMFFKLPDSDIYVMTSKYIELNEIEVMYAELVDNEFETWDRYKVDCFIIPVVLVNKFSILGNKKLNSNN